MLLAAFAALFATLCSLHSAALLRNLAAHLLDGTTVEAGVDRSCRSKAAVLAQKQRENCATQRLLTFPGIPIALGLVPITAILNETMCYVINVNANGISAEEKISSCFLQRSCSHRSCYLSEHNYPSAFSSAYF